MTHFACWRRILAAVSDLCSCGKAARHSARLRLERLEDRLALTGCTTPLVHPCAPRPADGQAAAAPGGERPVNAEPGRPPAHPGRLRADLGASVYLAGAALQGETAGSGGGNQIRFTEGSPEQGSFLAHGGLNSPPGQESGRSLSGLGLEGQGPNLGPTAESPDAGRHGFLFCITPNGCDDGVLEVLAADESRNVLPGGLTDGPDSSGGFIPLVIVTPSTRILAQGTTLPGADLTLVATLLNAAAAPRLRVPTTVPADETFSLFLPPASAGNCSTSEAAELPGVVILPGAPIETALAPLERLFEPASSPVDGPAVVEAAPARQTPREPDPAAAKTNEEEGSLTRLTALDRALFLGVGVLLVLPGVLLNLRPAEESEEHEGP